jgi:hypothetical protein
MVEPDEQLQAARLRDLHNLVEAIPIWWSATRADHVPPPDLLFYPAEAQVFDQVGVTL